MNQTLWIPEVPKRRIEELARKIHPVVLFKNAGLCYIEPVDLFKTAFTWEPRRAEQAPALNIICDIRTYHGYGYQAFFKPSIAEVLAQIPAEHLDKVVAFEIIEHPKTQADLAREFAALKAGYHVALTRLYSR